VAFRSEEIEELLADVSGSRLRHEEEGRAPRQIGDEGNFGYFATSETQITGLKGIVAKVATSPRSRSSTSNSTML